ncbi:MAG: hypothetical protein MPN21_08295 [Thermoanaerobaculia bacterium]|nr:hypothetical protein [Thermoanaerobaculia bacterium]
MSVSALDQLCRGSFAFLKPEPTEIRRVVPQIDEIVPQPQKIYLKDESATPLVGFPIAQGRTLEKLEQRFLAYVDAEIEVQVAYHTRASFDSKAYARIWESYRSFLDQVLDNATVSSVGRDYVGVFWLHHSDTVCRAICDIPRGLRRDHSVVGREHGNDIKYKVYFKWIDRITTLTYDIAHRLAPEMEVGEDELFPGLLALMRDNVLVFTEDYVSPDLTELSSYFSGCLKIDARDLKQRVKALDSWHDRLLRTDATVRAAAEIAGAAEPDPAQVLMRKGWMTFLSRHPRWNGDTFPTDAQIQVWEGLLDKIKEFEILVAMRKMLLPLEREGEKLLARQRNTNATWVGPPELELSPVTRPVDFGLPWVVNPVVQRYGLVYDITDFSSTLSMLGRAERTALDQAFRLSAQFQRRVNSLASSLSLKLEKYLGDGAFYSGRNPRRMLALAIHIQRLYPEFVDERSYPFDRGLRIALNFGEYRLLPLEPDSRGGEPRYEFFGHGLVELSRLTTGKKTQEVEAFKTYLVSQGYSDTAVNQFFGPMLQRNQDLVSKIDEARRFFAYINQTSTLINEGLVATEPFLADLGAFETMYYARQHGRGFIGFHLEEGGHSFLVGVRKLGLAKFKGLETSPVFEVVDGSHWDHDALKEIPSQPLLNHLERLFAKTVEAKKQAASSQLDDTGTAPQDALVDG